MTEDKIIELTPSQDMRVGNLAQAIFDFVHERGHGFPIATILGVLEIVKFKIIKGEDDA